MFGSNTNKKMLNYVQGIINTVREPLILLDQNLRVVTVSRSFYQFFKVKPEDTIGHLIYELGNRQWDIPLLRELLESILPQKSSFDDYQVEHDFAVIGRRIMLLNARQIEQVQTTDLFILLAIEDITERTDELVIANNALAFQVEEKDKRANELVILNQEKDKWTEELVTANEALAFQNKEKISERMNSLLPTLRKTSG